MGGNTYNRKYYTDKELELLISKVNGYYSLFKDDTLYDNEKQWRANISRYLDKDSCNRFYFMLEDIHYCTHCNEELSISSYVYSGYNRGFSKYCSQCTDAGVWRTMLSPDVLAQRGNK